MEQFEQEAMFKQARALMNGNGVDPDEAKAAAMYKQLAEGGYAPAMCYYGKALLNGWGTAKDGAVGLQWIMQSSDAGFSDAYVELGHCYIEGDVVEQDFDKAFYWYKKAADAGNHDGECNLAQCYINGEGVDVDFEQAYYWSLLAAEGGDGLAMYNLGLMCENGDGTDQDDNTAFMWYKRSAEAGYTESYGKMGLCYGLGIGTAQNHEEAVKWFKKAADSGDAQSYYNLGLSYLYGDGVEQDDTCAFELFQKAADEDYEDAYEQIALCYYKGRGTRQNYAEAAKWFLKAADSGDAEALYNLGICYRNGNGVDCNDDKALECFRKSANKGYEEAMRIIVQDYGRLQVQVPPDIEIPEDAEEKCSYATSILRTNPEEALSILKPLACAGYSEAQSWLRSYLFSDARDAELSVYWALLLAEKGDKIANLLSMHYEEGIGVPKDESVAFYWTQRCADQHPDDLYTRARLALLYIDGTGVEKDIKKGEAMLRQCAAKGEPYAQERLGFYCFYALKDYDQAFIWLRNSIKGGYEPAQKQLAKLQNEYERIRLAERGNALIAEARSLKSGRLGEMRFRKIDAELQSIENRIKALKEEAKQYED